MNKILKSAVFNHQSELSEFINDNKIKRENIQMITSTMDESILFYWINDAPVEESEQDE